MTETTTTCGVEFVPDDTTIPKFTCTRTEGGWFPDLHRTDTHWFVVLPTDSIYCTYAKCRHCRHRRFRTGCLCPTDGCRCQPGIRLVKPRNKPLRRPGMTPLYRLMLVINGAVLTAIGLLYPATGWAPPGILASATVGLAGSLYLLNRRSRP